MNKKSNEQNQKFQERVAELSRKIENMESCNYQILTQMRDLSAQKKRRFGNVF